MDYRILKKKYLDDILKIAKILPVVNQVECHLYSPCDDLRVELDKIKCYIEDWSPIGRGNKELLNEEILVELGKKIIKLFHKLYLDGICKKEILFSLKVVILLALKKI